MPIVKTLSLQIEASTHKKLKAAAALEERSITDIVKELIEKYLDTREGKE